MRWFDAHPELFRKPSYVSPCRGCGVPCDVRDKRGVYGGVEWCLWCDQTRWSPGEDTAHPAPDNP